jgi:hypothetical protein
VHLRATDAPAGSSSSTVDFPFSFLKDGVVAQLVLALVGSVVAMILGVRGWKFLRIMTSCGEDVVGRQPTVLLQRT